MHSIRPAALATALTAALSCAACDSKGVVVPSAGTPELRAALLDTILARTSRREAFSPPKQEALGFDALESMRLLEGEVVGAETDEALYYALAKVSNARRDSHLEVILVQGGLGLPDSAGVPIDGLDEEEAPPVRVAPVRVLPDYGEADGLAYFVADVSRSENDFEGPAPTPGDLVVRVGSWSVEEYLRYAVPYHRGSTDANRRWRIADAMTSATAVLPRVLRGERLDLTLQRDDGATYEVSLPFLHPDSITWAGLSEPQYPGFGQEHSTPTYDLHLSDVGDPVLVLQWYGFRETMIEDVDALMELAADREWLDYDLIIDGTRSRGGSAGAYALQRFTSQPFKTTFGNLRISDVVPRFIDEKRDDVRGSGALDSGVLETIDDGTWLMDWLETDVTAAIDAGEQYSNNVPFKLAHAPRDSDGFLQPAPVHFRGRLVAFFGPRRGSHLDQFAAIIQDNDLGLTLGMPAGGYSNTWEWEETLTYPGTDRPVAAFMWSIGHTLRPNGEILEGNPAPVDEMLPLTRENFATYYEQLLGRALEYLGHG